MKITKHKLIINEIYRKYFHIMCYRDYANCRVYILEEPSNEVYEDTFYCKCMKTHEDLVQHCHNICDSWNKE